MAMTMKVAHYYKNLLAAPSEFIDLKELPQDFSFSALYQNQGKNEDFIPFQEQIDALDKLVFIVPEYNGSFPGVLKTFLDGLRYPDTMKDKKVALVGVSSGVQGNAVGLSHLDDILSYMGANVLGLRVKLGEIYRYFDGEKFSNASYINFLQTQADKLLSF